MGSNCSLGMIITPPLRLCTPLVVVCIHPSSLFLENHALFGYGPLLSPSVSILWFLVWLVVRSVLMGKVELVG